MKFNLMLGLLCLCFSRPAISTEYIYRDLMADTLLSAKCESPSKAKETAQKSYKLRIFSKKFCQTQGYGWHVEEIMGNGEVDCDECTSNAALQQCRLKDVSVKCKRIKPGTVGLLPGKG